MSGGISNEERASEELEELEEQAKKLEEEKEATGKSGDSTVQKEVAVRPTHEGLGTFDTSGEYIDTTGK